MTPAELVTSGGALVGGVVVGRLADITEGRGVFLTGGDTVAKNFFPKLPVNLDSFEEPLHGLEVVLPVLFFLFLFFLGGGGILTGYGSVCGGREPGAVSVPWNSNAHS